MKKSFPRLSARNYRLFVICAILAGLVSFGISASSHSGDDNSRRDPSAAAAKKAGPAAFINSVLNFPMPLPSLTVTVTDTIPGDGPEVGKAGVGETIRYTVKIDNAGPDAANNLILEDTIDGNTTLVPGSIVTSPLAVNDTYQSVGNMTLTTSTLGADCNANPLRSVTCNETTTLRGGTLTGFGDSQANANATAAGGNVTVAGKGTMTLNADGTFVFNPVAGFEGSVDFWYTIGNTAGSDNAKITITVGGANGMVWFIDNTPPAASSNLGTQQNPFTSLASFVAINNGAGTGDTAADANNTIFLYESGTAYSGPVTLLSGQKFIGQDTTLSLATLGAPSAQPGNAYPAVNNPTADNVNIGSAAGGILLNSNNVMSGFTMTGVTGTALQGTNFGTLSLSGVNVSSSAQALSLTNGALAAPGGGAATFGTLSSGGGTNGILLSNVTGSMTASGGSLTGTATGPTFSVVGGTVSVTYSGGITQGANNAAVSVTGGHNTGTITFQTGTISATAGTGLQFSNADGTYNFNGTTTLGGGDAGVDILTDSAGSFTFASATSINSPSGTAFNVDGGGSTSTASVTYSGNITQASNAAMVSVTNHNTGTITFQTGTLNATNGTGLQFSNADSTSSYNFNGTTTLNGGDAGIDILSGSNGTFSFSASTSITRANGVAGEAFNLSSSNSNVTYSGSMSLGTSTGNLIAINNHDGGTVTFQTGNLTKALSTTQGINIQNSNAGTININNPTVTISSSTANAISLTGNTGGTMSFNPAGGGQGIDLTSTSGIGFNATGGGTVTVAGTSNTISSTTGIGLNVTSTEIGSTGLNFVSINTNGASSGIVLTSTGTAAGNGGLTVTGTATGSDRCGGTITNTNTPGTAATVNAKVDAECTGGTIQTTTAAGIILDNTKNTSLSRMRILNAGTDGISVNNINGFTLTNSQITDSSGVAQDRGIDLGDFSTGTAVNGTITITNSTLGPTPHDNFGVGIGSGTSTWSITGTLFDDSQLNSGFNFEIRNATVSSFNMSGCVLRNQFADGMQMQPSGSSTGTITTSTFQNNTFQGNNLAMDLNHDGTANITYRVINNTFLTSHSHAVNIFSSAVQAPTTGGTYNVRFEGNVIGNAASAGSGSAIGNGLRVNINGGTDATATILNNTIRQAPVGRGMEIISRNGTGGLDVTVAGNNVNHTNTSYCLPAESSPCAASFPLAAIFIQANCIGNCNSVRADVRGNTVPSGTASDLLTTYIQVLETAGAPVTGTPSAVVVDNAPTPSASATAELTESHTNPAHNNTGSASAESDVGLHNGSINTVAVNMLQLNESQQQYYALNDSDNSNNSLLAFVNNNKDSNSFAALMSASVSGTSATVGTELGKEETGAGLTSGSMLNSSTGVGAALGSFTSEIEKGAFALAHGGNNSPTLAGRLSRAVSAVAEAVAPSAHAAPAPMPALEVNENLGSLPAGKSVTVVFEVTVNGPHPFASYTNNATVKATGIADIQKQNITPGDRYNNTTALTASPTSPASQGETVTFTATVTPSEAVGTANPATGGFVQFKDNGVAIGAPVACTADGNNCKAELQTSSLTPGMHPITAEYLGGTHHEASASGATNYTVNACTSNPVVTTIADGTAPVPAGSLREALTNVCGSNLNNTITFATGAGQAFDPATGPHVIQLVAALPAITKNIIVQGPGANQVEVRGSQVNLNSFRVFTVDSAATNVQISGLTISGGSDALGGGGVNNAGTLTLSACAVGTSANTNITTGSGGGIYNSGTLTIDRCTISNNVAALSGGGIFNAALATLTVKNSTISTNTSNGGANTGGGVNSAGTATFTNVTVAANLLGGGITNANVTPTSFTIGNTIVADSAGGSNDLTGIFNSAGYNLFEDAGTATIGGTTTGNQTGVDPKLGALFNNGGPTLTHALLSGSTAIDAGDNTLATNAGLTTTDQRGTGFPRNADGADVNATQTVDIGAFELHPSVEDIADKSTAEDTALDVTFNIGDATGVGSPLITSVTATSGNTTLVPNANLVISAVAGSDTQRKLTITPAANANTPVDGTATITVTVTATNGQTATDTFVLTVTEVNDSPTATNDTLTDVAEDSGQRTITIASLLGNDSAGPANENAQTLTLTGVGSAIGGTVSNDATNVYFTPQANYSGAASFQYTVSDNGTTSGSADPKTATGTVSFNVTAVNDAPSLLALNGDSVGFTEDGAAVKLDSGSNAAINDPDPVDFNGGTLTVAITTNKVSTEDVLALDTTGVVSLSAGMTVGSTVSVAGTPIGTIAANGTGTGTDNLIINLVSPANGPSVGQLVRALTYNNTNTGNPSTATRTITYTLVDGGGTAGGGADTGTATSQVTVTAVNDDPTLTNNGLTVGEGSTGNTITSAALSLSDPDDPGSTSHVYQLSSVPANGTIKKSGTAIGVNDTFSQDDLNNNRITYDHNGSETTSDSFNFTAAGVTGTQTFNINVTAQNDAPTLATNNPLMVVPGTTGTVDNTKLLVSDADNTAADLVYTVGTAPVNGDLKNNGATLASGGTFTQDDVNNNLVTYTHNGGPVTTDSFTFTVSDGAGGSIGTTTFNININCTSNPVVTGTNDSGPGSLREAIQTACAGSNITFNLDSSTDAGYDSVTDTFTIKLTTGELLISRNMTITGPNNQRVIVSGNNTDPNPANRSRVFNIASGTVTIHNLTIANGESQFGGGIYNLGDLTLVSVTLRGNKAVAVLGAGGDGGAIDSDSGTLTIYNSTISGNTADGGGGGIHNCGDSTATLLNVTITGNRSDADDLSPGEGGGLEQVSSNSLTLSNTIVAGNLKGTATPVAEDISVFGPGGIDLANSKNNLIGDAGTSGGITNGGANGNIVGNAGAGTIDINTVLDVTLANNGGPTPTHKLMPGSPAINKGSDALVDSIGLPTDQRLSGFNRKIGTVDIGAFEVQAGTGNSLAFNVQPSNTNAGVAITPAVTVRILDVLGNLTTSTANVTLAIGNNPSGGTLSGTTTVAAVNGTATFSDLSINNIGVGYTLAATSTGLAGATSNAFNIVSASLVTGTKTVSGTFSVGQAISYTITLINSSAGTQLDNAGNELTDVLPAGMTLVSASATSGTAVATLGTNTVTWNGTIPGNSSVTITINATINAGTSGQTLSNQGAIAYDADGNGTNEAAGVTDDPGVAGAGNPTAFIVNAVPTITPVGVTRKAGDAGSGATIANVNDLEDAENALTVTVNNGASATVNGVTVSGLSVSAAGVVTASVEAACGATNAGFTLKVADTGGQSSTGTLNVTVNPNTAPVLSYSTQGVDVNGSLNFNPATGPSDSNAINTIAVLNAGTYTGGISVNNATGAISITNAAPAGSHTITIRATDACGLTTDAQFTLNVNKLNQTVTFNPTPPLNRMFGDADFQVNATASSGLAVTYGVTGPCTINGNTVHLTGAGDCTLTATQAGDGTYNQASTQQVFTINKAFTHTVITSSVNPSAPGQNVTFTATVNANGVTPTGTLQFKVNGVNQGAPVNLDANGSASFSTSTLVIGTHTISADYSGGANFTANTGTMSVFQTVSIQSGLSISDVSVTEGNSGTVSAVFTVTLSQSSAVAVTVDYATADNTATTADSDYQSATGTLTFNAGETSKTVTVLVNGDTKNEPNETFFVNLTNAVNANIGDNQGTGTITNDDGPTVQLSNSTYTINEGANNTPQGFTSLAVDVIRTGDTSQPATVRYITSDASGGNECTQVTGQASQRCDYILVGATLRFAAGETTKTIQIPIVNDGYLEGAEFLNIELTNASGVTIGSLSSAIITIQDDAADATPTTSANNPYLSNPFFVRQNYLDLLGRDADQAGFTDWTNVLNNCGPQQGFLGAPLNCDRAHVSHGFFASPEFTRSGLLIYRLFEVGMDRLPLYREFIPDMATLSGFNLTPAQEQQNLADYLQEFTSKQEFINRFQDVSQPAQAALFIERLEQTAGVTLPATATTLPGQPTQYGRQELINLRANGTLTLGQTLKAFVEQKVIYDLYFPSGHVTMLYFAYLRRDPNLNDPGLVGWNDWVDVFTNGKPSAGIPPRDIHHLIFGFIYSEEYRKRFGQP